MDNMVPEPGMMLRATRNVRFLQDYVEDKHGGGYPSIAIPDGSIVMLISFEKEGEFTRGHPYFKATVLYNEQLAWDEFGGVEHFFAFLEPYNGEIEEDVESQKSND